MKAGRELDAHIDAFIFKNSPQFWTSDFSMPRYSTNKADAMSVLEKFDGYRITKYVDSGNYKIVINKNINDVYVLMGSKFGETVCNCALRTI